MKLSFMFIIVLSGNFLVGQEFTRNCHEQDSIDAYSCIPSKLGTLIRNDQEGVHFKVYENRRSIVLRDKLVKRPR